MKNEELFYNIQTHLLEDEKPGKYLNQMLTDKQLREYPFSMLEKLKETPQSPKYHPEGNAWNHTILVVNEAAKVKNQSSNSVAFMWAALLHDIGKPDTTRMRKGRITSYNHDIEGEKLAREFLKCFNLSEKLCTEIVQLVSFHMHILYVVNKLPYGRIEEMKRSVNIKDLALLGWCDRMGRTNANPKEEEACIKKFYQLVKP